MKKFLLLFCALALVSSPLHSQKEAYNWFFGLGSGVKFHTGSPTPVNQSEVNTQEGTAVISDKDGNLLFYTDGTWVWNRNHVLMNTTEPMQGHVSSTQSALIVPHPNDEYLYYLFSVDAEGGPNGIHYYLVDMQSNGGLGAIPLHFFGASDNDSTLNNENASPYRSTEKITAVKNDNGRDYWLITHEWDNNRFHVYDINQGGANTTPTWTKAIGTPHTRQGSGNQPHARGYMKSSPTGEKVALAIFEGGVVEVFDFDRVTGEITGPSLTITNADLPGFNIDKVYGIEFSPDGSLLYFSTLIPNQVFQVDLNNPDPIGSIQRIGFVAPGDGENQCAALQIAPDGKIYFASQGSSSLGVINNPGVIGAGCDFIYEAVPFSLGETFLGLPNFIPSFFRPDIGLAANTPVCSGDTIFFTTNYINGAIYSWTGPNGFTSKLQNPIVPDAQLADAGQYIVEVELLGVTNADTIDVAVMPSPYIEISNQDSIEFCQGETRTISTNTNGITYDILSWSNGESTETIVVNSTGLYVVKAENNNGCIYEDSIYVTVHETPQLDIISKADVACEGETIDLIIQTNVTDYTSIWSSGQQNADTIVASLGGSYSVTITDSNGCENTATVDLTIGSPEPVVLGPNVICPDETIVLSAGADFSAYEWAPGGETTKEISVTQPGTYTLTVTDIKGCTGEYQHIVEGIDFAEYFEEITDLYLGRFDFNTGSGPIVINVNNDRTQDITIENVSMKSNSGVITVSAGGQKDFSVGQDIPFTFEFTPQGLAEESDILVIEISGPCQYIYETPVRAIGTAELKFWIDKYQASPGDSLEIPLWAQLMVNSQSVSYDFEYQDLDIRFPVQALAPNLDKLSDTNFAVTAPYTIDNGQLTINVEAPRLITVNNTPQKVAQFFAHVSFMDAIAPLEIVNLQNQDTVLTVTIENGEIDYVGVCRRDLQQIGLFEPIEGKIAPNPASGQLNLIIETSLKGDFKAEIFNLAGIKAAEFEWYYPANSRNVIEKTLDASDLSSGVYQLVITKGGSRVAIPFSIYK